MVHDYSSLLKLRSTVVTPTGCLIVPWLIRVKYLSQRGLAYRVSAPRYGVVRTARVSFWSANQTAILRMKDTDCETLFSLVG